jgi:hypothetical protein
VQACREALRKENLRVEWQQANKRWVATFYFPRHDESLHVIAGDELILQHESGALPLVWRTAVHAEHAVALPGLVCAASVLNHASHVRVCLRLPYAKYQWCVC